MSQGLKGEESDDVYKKTRNEIYSEDLSINIEIREDTNKKGSKEEKNDDPKTFFTNEFCTICGQGGDLLICEHCPKVFHLKCMGLTTQPKDDFICNYCKGISSMDCARCFKNVYDVDFFHREKQQQQIFASKIQLIPVQCSLCLSQMHIECVEVSLKLLFKGAYYYDLSDNDVNELLQQFEKFKDLQKINNPEDPIQFYDCYCLIKFQYTAFIHAIWVQYSTAENLGKTKTSGYERKYQLETYQDLMYHQNHRKYEQEYMDNFHNIQLNCLMPDRILDQYKRGQYFLVKWKQLDHTFCTWEPQYFVSKYCNDLRIEYIRMLQTQELINDMTPIGASYRFDLMKCRDLHTNLQLFVPLSDTPNFINRQNEEMKLHDYQIEGINWMIHSWQNKTNVILADEMGLGKTVQAISFISYLMNVQQITRPFLICVPLSTIDNWIREFAAWCPEARVLPYISEQKSRQICREKEFYYHIYPNHTNSYIKQVKIPMFNVLLTSYNFLLTDYKHLIEIPWRCIIIDEGQRLKNNDSKIFKLASTMMTEHRILLSGTPLQNNISELFNLLEYLDPKKFNAEFKENFQKKFSESIIVQDNKAKIQTQKKDVDVNEEQKAETNNSWEEPKEPQQNDLNIEQEQSVLEMLQSMLKPHILRRFKRDVFKNFPKKKEVIIRVDMTQRQKTLSKLLIERSFEELSLFEQQKNTGKVSVKGANNIMMLLRMIANHPLLLTELYCTEDFRQTQFQKNKKDSIMDDQQYSLNTVKDFVKDSGKLQHFDKMIDLLLEKGHRILVFSQFKGTLDILQDYLKIKGILCLRLDGDTQNHKRQKLIDLFNAENSKFKLFLLSTKAGGLGINLTSADTIVIFDSDFNPHNDIQALNRAHRIGQKKNVMIYRFACKHSVEEKILEMAKHKLMLDTVMAHSANKDQKKESNQLYQILKFGTKKLFEQQEVEKQDQNYEYVVDDQQLQKILDRDQQFKELEEEGGNEVKDYLSAFKVANIEKKIIRSEINAAAANQDSDSESSSDEEGDSANDNIFSRLLNEQKENDKPEQMEVQVEENNGMQTRNKNKYPKPQPLKNGNKEQLQVDTQASLEQKAMQAMQQQDATLLQQPRSYEMSQEYAEFLGGVYQGQYQLHHDGQFYLSQMLGQLTSTINPPVMIPGSAQYLQQSQNRINILKKAQSDKKHNADYLQILMTNEDPNLSNILPFIKLWGFDIYNIKDFVIGGLLKFGVQNKKYTKLYSQILKQYARRGQYSTIFYIQEDIFVEFSQQFFEFQRLLTEQLRQFLEIPQFLFSNYTCFQLAYRNYELTLIRKYCEKMENQTVDGMQKLLKHSSQLKWDRDLDNYVLCKLIMRYGYGEYDVILNDQIWLIMNPQILQRIQEIFQGTIRLNQFVKSVKNFDRKLMEKVLRHVELDERFPRYVLYQKLSGVAIAEVKKQFGMQQSIQSQDGNMLQSLIQFNTYVDDYCLAQIEQVTQEFILHLRKNFKIK